MAVGAGSGVVETLSRGEDDFCFLAAGLFPAVGLFLCLLWAGSGFFLEIIRCNSGLITGLSVVIWHCFRKSS